MRDELGLDEGKGVVVEEGARVCEGTGLGEGVLDEGFLGAITGRTSHRIEDVVFFLEGMFV